VAKACYFVLKSKMISNGHYVGIRLQSIDVCGRLYARFAHATLKPVEPSKMASVETSHDYITIALSEMIEAEVDFVGEARKRLLDN
jgi:hypothetical protein